MKIYSAIKKDDENIKHYGSMRKIAKDIGCSPAYVSRCYLDNKPCKGYDILFSVNYPYKVKLTQKEKLHTLINTLKRAKIIIDDNNKFLTDNGEYANINILNDIDRCLGYYKSK